jgi:hypothetical protein
MKLVIAALLGSSLTCFAATENTPSSIEIETIIQSTSSWDTHVMLHVLWPSRHRTKMTNEARSWNTEVLPFQ